MSDRLARLGAGIERLVLEPESISAPFTRLLRPFYHRLGWKPETRIDAARDLVAALSAADPQAVRDAFDDAVGELEDNLEEIERATVISRRPLVAYAAWLRRLYEVLVHAERALDALADDPDALALALRPPAAGLRPPLVAAGAVAASRAEPDAGEHAGPDPGRVLELQLDAIDHLMAAARASGEELGRRRRLLEAARQLLLETSAALPLDGAGVHARLTDIADDITTINRLQAAGVRGDVTLLHQARTALDRGERARLHAVLQALHRAANDRGDARVSRLCRGAIATMTGHRVSTADPLSDVERSAAPMLGERVVDAVRAGYERARQQNAGRARDGLADMALDVVAAYFAPGQERATLANALAVDGCFEVGGVLTPVRVHEEYTRRVLVGFPTQDLTLVTAAGPNDLPAAVIVDPRTVLMDLAAGRLLARRYLREERSSRERTEMQGEVRVYVLDGSGSMIGPRARMRDAILTAELATLARRLQDPLRDSRVTLYFRYFDHELGPVTRVTSIDEALAAISEVVSTRRAGGTDIQGALLSSLSLVQTAHAEDPDLSRAQIVLITDGEAPLSTPVVDQARSALGDRAVGISVIALGEENRALRQLVARQRRLGERAFYHFLPDAYLARVSSGQVDDGTPVHVPAVPWHEGGAAPLPEAELARMLDEIGDIERDRQREALHHLDHADRSARLEPGASHVIGEGARAHLEASLHDDEAIARRFRRWYPPPAHAGAAAEAAAGTRERDDLDAVLVLCAAVVEVLEIVGRSPRDRQADAVELLERLLPSSRLSPARFHEVLRLFPVEVAPALEAVHAVVREGVWWRMTLPPSRRPAPEGPSPV